MLWLSWTDRVTLFVQTLYQAESYAMTLLLVERDQSDLGVGEW